MKKILTIQDISCYGQCSITVALPILSSYGIETAILPSAILSTHTAGFTNYTVLDLTSEMPKIINHFVSEKISFDAIYTGYIGDVRQFDYILACKNKLMTNGLLIVDPAMADHGKLYPALNASIISGMKKIAEKADVLIPNITEACFLLDIPYHEDLTKKEYEELLIKLNQKNAGLIILTSVVLAKDRIGAMAYDGNSFYFYDTPKNPKSFHGTGDAFSSVFIGKYLESYDIFAALKEACEFVYQAILLTNDDLNHTYGIHFEEILKNKSQIIK